MKAPRCSQCRQRHPAPRAARSLARPSQTRPDAYWRLTQTSWAVHRTPIAESSAPAFPRTPRLPLGRLRRRPGCRSPPIRRGAQPQARRHRASATSKTGSERLRPGQCPRRVREPTQGHAVFARRGLVPEGCSTWFLPRVVGISAALEWTVGAKMVSGAEALRAAWSAKWFLWTRSCPSGLGRRCRSPRRGPETARREGCLLLS